MDCVKQWRYKPIVVDGQATLATTIIPVTFDLSTPPGAAKADPAAAAVRSCMDAVSSNASVADQVQLCQQAVDAENASSTKNDWNFRRLLFMYASTAFRRNKQYTEAVDYASQSVAAAEKVAGDPTAIAGSLDARAQAEALLGNLQAASDDLTRAEDLTRAALARQTAAGNLQLVKLLLPSTKARLSFHAQLLRALGKPDEAAARTEEAAKL